MNPIWTFSQSSETLLQRCIAAAAHPDESNKWFQKFGQIQSKNERIYENHDVITINESQKSFELHSEGNKETNSNESVIETEDIFFDNIEIETLSRFDAIVEECLRNPKIITKLAQKLSGITTEKICNEIFSRKDLGADFIDKFYQNFFPVYVKRDCSRFSLDLLVKAYKSHPMEFKKLVYLLIKDLKIPNKVIQDFVSALDEEDKSLFLLNLSEIDLTAEEFGHNLFAIYLAYKNSKKTERLQNIIFYYLLQHATHSTDEKNFGKLMLAFLQEQSNIGFTSDHGKLKKVIEVHKTPFKKPCLNILKGNLI